MAVRMGVGPLTSCNGFLCLSNPLRLELANELMSVENEVQERIEDLKI